MESASYVAELIVLGNDIITIKMYAICVTALWSYDYLLTFEDEVEYAWKTKNVLMFTLFLITRYLPVPFLIWMVISSWSPSYSVDLCKKTVFLQIVYFALITFAAHTVLTLRVHAITGKNRLISGTLYGLSILQLGVGVYLCVYAALNPLELPQLDLDSYRICLFQISTFGSLLYTSLSLVFDLGVFLITFLRLRTLRTQRRSSSIPNILDTVAGDTATYFLVIFSSHFALVLTLTLVRPLLRFLPTVGNVIFVPMMITRIILSLKKAVSAPPKFEMVEVPIRSV